jgi:rubrerythrin
MSASRRDLLLAGGAVVAAPLLRAGDALAQASSGDAAILHDAIALELAAVEAYQSATGQLGGIARLFRNHERAHAEALSVALRRVSRQAPPTAGAAAAAPLIAAVRRARTKKAAATALIRVEDTAVKAYLDAHRKLEDARLMQLVSTIIGNQGQHLVALRDVAGQQKVPTAFETGRA